MGKCIWLGVGILAVVLLPLFPGRAEAAKPILAFEEETVPVYDREGRWLRDIPAQELGDPRQLEVVGKDNRGMLIVRHLGNTLLIDSMWVTLDPGFDPAPVDVRCPESAVNQRRDRSDAVSMGVGECR